MLCPYYLLYVLCFILPLDHEIGYVAFACFQVFDSSQRFSWPSTENRQEVHENLEKVPRIWEGEGARRSEILNPINNDYWVSKCMSSICTEFLLWRNGHIKNVALFEDNPILPLPESLGSSYCFFSWSDVFVFVSQLPETDQDKKLSLGSLQTL